MSREYARSNGVSQAYPLYKCLPVKQGYYFSDHEYIGWCYCWTVNVTS